MKVLETIYCLTCIWNCISWIRTTVSGLYDRRGASHDPG